MNQSGLVIIAVSVATLMAVMVRVGATPSLRSAIRTTMVLAFGWTLAYAAVKPIAWTNISWRVLLMALLSVLALALGWWLYSREAKKGPQPGPARADRFNVLIAAAFSVLLLLGSAPQRYGLAALLVTGAMILAWNRG